MSASSIATGELTVTATFSGGCPVSTDAAPATQVLQVSLSEVVSGCFVQGIPSGPIDFGNVAVNSSAQLQVTTPTEFCSPQESSFVELGGGEGSPFSVVSNNGPSWTIAFSPTTTGTQSSSLGFTFVGNNTPVCEPASLAFTVTGTGVP